MKGVRGKTGEVRRGLATSGVQLATARSKAQKAQKVSRMCRGDAPVLAQRYKTQEVSSVYWARRC